MLNLTRLHLVIAHESQFQGLGISGFKFVRQEAIGSYVVDFVCREERLIIEVDGGQHADNPRDLARDAALRAEGYHVLRFWNSEILTNEDGVLTVILAKLQGIEL